MAEGPRAVRRTVNPNRDRDEPEMQEVLEMLAMLEMLEVLKVQAMLDCHGSRTGTLFASSPGLTEFRSGARPVKGLELVVEKRRLCGDLSSESALASLQKTPPRHARRGFRGRRWYGLRSRLLSGLELGLREPRSEAG